MAGLSLTNIVNAASFPSLKVEPESISFTSFEVGSSSPVQTVTITNDVDSTNVLTIFDIYLDGPDANSFAIVNDNCSGRILDGSISLTLELLFKPVSAGIKNATLMIPTNATVKPYELALSGTGIVSNNNKTIESIDSVIETTSSTDKTPGPTDDSSSFNWLLIIIILPAVILVIAVILISKRLVNK